MRRVADRWGLPALPENTITDLEELLAELETIRDQEYSIADEEYVVGLRTVSRVVRQLDGEILGALSVSRPAYRMTGEVLHGEIMDAHREAVESLEEAIATDFPANIYDTGNTTRSRGSIDRCAASVASRSSPNR